MKAHTDDNIDLTQKLNFILRQVENTSGKREIAGNQHLLLFPKCFQKLPPSGSLKVGIVWSRVMPFPHNDAF